MKAKTLIMNIIVAITFLSLFFLLFGDFKSWVILGPSAYDNFEKLQDLSVTNRIAISVVNFFSQHGFYLFVFVLIESLYGLNLFEITKSDTSDKNKSSLFNFVIYGFVAMVVFIFLVGNTVKNLTEYGFYLLAFVSFELLLIGSIVNLNKQRAGEIKKIMIAVMWMSIIGMVVLIFFVHTKEFSYNGWSETYRTYAIESQERYPFYMSDLLFLQIPIILGGAILYPGNKQKKSIA